MTKKRNILITGGVGFIGLHVARLFVNKYLQYKIINLDALTYAGNLDNLKDIEKKTNYSFVKVDICDYDTIVKIVRKYNIDRFFHLAAESHVDRSINDPFIFAKTNVLSTLTLLQATKDSWLAPYKNNFFYHFSSDEIYGALEFNGTFFTVDCKYEPHIPYSARKASIDHFVRAFHDTCCLPFYGKRENVRDWLLVEDHARAIDIIFHKGISADAYNIGGSNDWKNIDPIKVIIKTVDRLLLGKPEGAFLPLITYVTDIAVHDLRYAIDSTKLKSELRWESSLQFEKGIGKTVKWYLDNQQCLDNVTSGDYQLYYERMYKSECINRNRGYSYDK